ncbi:MAG: aldo/keto reductase [Promethearchaeota archaeon]
MNYRALGNTGLKVSELGLGTEHLYKQPKQTVISVIQKAIKHDFNYIDIVFNVSNYVQNIGAAIKGCRENVILTCHLGSVEQDGKPRRTRNLKACEKAFLHTMSNLHTEYIDIVNIQFVKENEFKAILKPGGLIDLALKLQKEEKVRYISLSTHDTSVGIKAIESGNFDMIMYPVNVVNDSMEGRRTLLEKCKKKNIGLVAIKPFAGGKLLQKNRTVNIAKYQTGGISLKTKIPPYVCPAKCINYILVQVGISTTIPGVSNLEELNEILTFFTATDEEKDFSALVKAITTTKNSF